MTAAVLVRERCVSPIPTGSAPTVSTALREPNIRESHPLTSPACYCLPAPTQQWTRTDACNLNRIAGRQSMTEMFAAASYHFLELLGAWCKELQRVTQGLTGDAREPSPLARSKLVS